MQIYYAFPIISFNKIGKIPFIHLRYYGMNRNIFICIIDAE